MSAAALTVTTPRERELVMTRVFDAPRNLVFDALTKPELIRRWYGPAGWSMVICEIDLRVDGAWRFVSRRPDGKQIGQQEVRDMLIKSGMTSGAAETYDKLAECLASIA